MDSEGSHLYRHVYIYMYICVCGIYICMYIYISTYIYTYICLSTCVHILYACVSRGSSVPELIQGCVLQSVGP